MFIKKCGFCKEKIKTNSTIKRFCNSVCQRKDYNRRPEIKEINRRKSNKLITFYKNINFGDKNASMC